MVVTGPKNYSGLTDKTATDAFQYYAKRYITGLAQQHYYNLQIWRLEQYLKTKYHLKGSIYELLSNMMDNTQLMLNEKNYFKIIIPKIDLPKIKDMSCDELFRLTLYGNRNVRGAGLIEDIFKSAFIHF